MNKYYAGNIVGGSENRPVWVPFFLFSLETFCIPIVKSFVFSSLQIAFDLVEFFWIHLHALICWAISSKHLFVVYIPCLTDMGVGGRQILGDVNVLSTFCPNFLLFSLKIFLSETDVCPAWGDCSPAWGDCSPAWGDCSPPAPLLLPTLILTDTLLWISGYL